MFIKCLPKCHLNLYFQDHTINSPYCIPYIYLCFSSENLVLNQALSLSYSVVSSHNLSACLPAYIAKWNSFWIICGSERVNIVFNWLHWVKASLKCTKCKLNQKELSQHRRENQDSWLTSYFSDNDYQSKFSFVPKVIWWYIFC